MPADKMPRMPFDPAQVLRLAHDTLDIEAAAVLGCRLRFELVAA